MTEPRLSGRSQREEKRTYKSRVSILSFNRARCGGQERVRAGIGRTEFGNSGSSAAYVKGRQVSIWEKNN